MLTIDPHDIVVVLLLVVLEGILSADNAIVLAVLAHTLPKHQQKKALRYGIAGAFIFRSLAVLLAVHIIETPWLKLVGGLYLLYLPAKYFLGGWMKSVSVEKPAVPPRRFLGLSQFWSTVVAIELTDMIFSIDSILAAVGLSQKVWVVITGGVLGIIAMRFVAGGFLRLIEMRPGLVEGAYLVVAWIGIKLIIQFLHQEGILGFEIPKLVTYAIIIVVILASLLLGKRSFFRRTSA
jgi:YkoY family integral membrane protein